MAERVLLTGAAGFVGRPLVGELAARGLEVHALSRRDRTWETPGAVWHCANLLDTGVAGTLLRDIRPSVVVHCAWDVAHGEFWNSPRNLEWLEASTELAASFFEAGGRRFVGIGTCAEYAPRDHGDGQPWPETRTIAPVNVYGRAKAELARRLMAMADARTGVGVAWGRLFHLFGPGEAPQRLVPSIVGALLDGREALCGSEFPVRDFSSTWFTAKALAALTASRLTGPVNVGSGQPRSIGEMARLVARMAGRADLVRFGVLPLRSGEAPFAVPDVSRLRQCAGFAAQPDICADLRRLVERYRSLQEAGLRDATDVQNRAQYLNVTGSAG